MPATDDYLQNPRPRLRRASQRKLAAAATLSLPGASRWLAATDAETWFTPADPDVLQPELEQRYGAWRNPRRTA